MSTKIKNYNLSYSPLTSRQVGTGYLCKQRGEQFMNFCLTPISMNREGLGMSTKINNPDLLNQLNSSIS
jgi:hypothetical protein